MTATIIAIIVGIIFGGLWTLLVTAVTKKKSWVLQIINSLFGALGAVSANQLLVYGPSILGISIVPAITGAVVLAFVVTYVYLKITK